jgi:hypothetical protein
LRASNHQRIYRSLFINSYSHIEKRSDFGLASIFASPATAVFHHAAKNAWFLTDEPF